MEQGGSFHLSSPTAHLLRYSQLLEELRAAPTPPTDLQEVFDHLWEERRGSLREGVGLDQGVEEAMMAATTLDWLVAIHPALLASALKHFRHKLISTSLGGLQPTIASVLPSLLSLLPSLPSLPSPSPGSVEHLPTSTWRLVLRHLLPGELACAAATCRHLRRAAGAPQLWRRARLRQAAMLLHGFPHFLAIRRYSQMGSLDFSSVGLNTSELTSICHLCHQGHLQVL